VQLKKWMKIKSPFVVCFSLRLYRVTMEKIIARNVNIVNEKKKKKFKKIRIKPRYEIN
jgi:hypothetical protein